MTEDFVNFERVKAIYSDTIFDMRRVPRAVWRRLRVPCASFFTRAAAPSGVALRAPHARSLSAAAATAERTYCGALTLDETPDGGEKVWSDEDDDGEVVGAAPAVPKQAKKQVRAVPKAKDLKAQKIAEMRAKEKAKAAERAARRARLNPNMDEAALQRKGNCSLEFFSLYHITEYFTNIMIF